MITFGRITTLAAAGVLAAGVWGSAEAATMTVSQTFEGNDCSGFFGQGFGSCNIFVNDETGQRIELSPVIAKFDNEDATKNEFNTALYPSITGAEFSFDASATGSWTYTPGADDPGVRYWAAKGGNNFNLFWTVDETATQVGGACYGGGNLYTLACLSEALTVQGGLFATPINPNNGKNFGLSPPSVVPLPAAGFLLLGALGGLGLMARRRRRAA
ncbi:MAG: hypothetical protein CVT80_03425 [Alphaproteobacteria bacterium HGW-Alphaproteobacteria-2]|nr:MAG: hypothetical protein CVT80_03425 [Alphaproteobacteria bacterium HGW-Alphaproteobacteria-2]